MKNLKFWLSTFCLVTLFATSTIAASSSDFNSDPTTISEQFQKYLQKIDISELNEEKELLVDFIITAKGEILVLSTNDKVFDKKIKSNLNYRTLKNHDLKVNEKYTVSVTFRKI